MYHVHLPVIGENVHISDVDTLYTVTTIENPVPPYDSVLITNTLTNELSRLIIIRGKWQVEYYNIPHEITFTPQLTTNIPQEIKFTPQLTTNIPHEITFTPQLTTNIPQEIKFPSRLSPNIPQEIKFPLQLTTNIPQEIKFPSRLSPNIPQEIKFPPRLTANVVAPQIKEQCIDYDYEELINGEQLLPYDTKIGAQGIFISKAKGYGPYSFTVTKNSGDIKEITFDKEFPFYKTATRKDLRKRTIYLDRVAKKWRFKGETQYDVTQIIFPKEIQNIDGQLKLKQGDRGIFKYVQRDITPGTYERKIGRDGRPKMVALVTEKIKRNTVDYNFTISDVSPSGKSAVIVFDNIPSEVYKDATCPYNPNARTITLRKNGLWVFKGYVDLHAGERIVA